MPIASVSAMNGPPRVDGVYIDPIHAPTTFSANIYNVPDPWMGGIRFMAPDASDPLKFTAAGCDDNIHWWTLYGTFSDPASGAIDLDFGPKAPAVGKLKCLFKRTSATFGAIGFLDRSGSGLIENSWPQLEATADFAFVPLDKFSAFNDINSLYADKATYKAGSFAGLHVISDRHGRSMRDELVTVGTADGAAFATHGGGSWVDKEKGAFVLGNGMTGTILKNEITFESGETWVKVTPGLTAPRQLCDPIKIERPIPQAVIDYHA